MRTQFLVSAALAATVAASPVIKNRAVTTVTVSGATSTTYPQPAVEIQGFPVHQSCNGTERNQLEKALGDTIKISQQALKHIYTHGNESEMYSKYFGVAPTAEVIGWYEKILYGDREGVLFRCDDIDGNCHQEGMLFSSSSLFPYSDTNLGSSQVGVVTGAAQTPLMRPSFALFHTPHASLSRLFAVAATQSQAAS
jgi:hypothetical protein